MSSVIYKFTSFTTSNSYIVKPFNDEKCFIVDLPPDLDSVIEFIKKNGRNLDIRLERHPFILKLIKIAEKSTGQKLKIFRKSIEFRVVRPGSEDNNPLHRDHWFPYFKPLLNIYLPISGSYFNSSLAIVPFSHKWTDKEVVPTISY